MTFHEWAQILFFAGLIICITPVLGFYIASIFLGKKIFIHSFLGWLEKSCYLIGNIDPTEEMDWKTYGKCLFLFNFLGFISVFFIQLFQYYLPLNPQHFPAVSWSLAFNTAASFVTNTNWQSYAGETTLSYFTQMIALTVQNFLSAGTGLSVLMALIRGIAIKTSASLGNFWVDLVRSVVYLLFPFAIILAVLLVSQGVIQTLSPYHEISTLENKTQIIPLGPVASQISIKQLGTNGGGFFNTNSAHPFENPTPFSNFLELLAIVIIPAATTYGYGLIIGSKKQGWLLFFVMFSMWLIGLLISLYSHYQKNLVLGIYPVLEGIETRIGVSNSLLWGITTTATSNGSVNAMLSSLSPLSGGVCLFNIMLGELIFGGVGVGMCSMLMFVFLTVFLSGLMVGRTPEYLGKKIEKKEMQWVTVSILTPGALILIGSAIAIALPSTMQSLANSGPHGLSEILYSFTSSSGNNGSAFAGFNANTLFFNLLLGLFMLIARMAIILPSLAIAGLLAKKRITPPSVGTFSTDTFLFIILLISVILIVGALTFFPALSLGPIAEELLLRKGYSF